MLFVQNSLGRALRASTYIQREAQEKIAPRGDTHESPVIHAPCLFVVNVAFLALCRVATANVSVPIKLLHEGEGHAVTVEMKNGEIYRGHLNDAEDTMNCFMTGGELFFSRRGSCIES